MATYYFTYGMSSPVQAYCKGWTEVVAGSREEAVRLYKLHHPLTKDGLLPCCGVALTKEEMEREYLPGISMMKDGNGGVYVHDRITGPDEREVFK